MEITKNTKVSEVIKHKIEAIDAIASINPHFEKLRNPILRKLFASRVTLSEAAKIGNCDVDILLKKLEEIGFKLSQSGDQKTSNETENQTTELKNTSGKISYFDIDPSLKKGIDPFNEIMKLLKAIPQNETLCIVSPFKPIPLIRILSEKNYDCQVKEEATKFYTSITKRNDTDTKQTTEPNDENSILCSGGEFKLLFDKYIGRLIEIDVREMEMPGPMVTILEEISTLPENYALFVQHKKIPQYLLPELCERQFKCAIHEVNPSHVQLLIYK